MVLLTERLGVANLRSPLILLTPPKLVKLVTLSILKALFIDFCVT